MWKCFLALAVIVLVHEAYAAYTCSNNIVTVKYQGQPYYFPAQGADDHYSSNQNCSWAIQIPDGYYAKWGFHANLLNAEGVSDDVETATVYGDLETWQFWFGNGWDTYTDTLSDQIKIILKSGNDSVGTFRFNVTWMKQVPPATPIVRNVDDYSYSILNLWELNNDKDVVTFAIGSDAQLSLATDCTDDTQLTDVWVYDGTDTTGAHHNLEDAIFNELEQSVNHAFTLYNPILDAPLSKCVVIANDARDTSQFEQYNLFYDPYNNNRRDGISVPATAQKPHAITYYSPDGQPITLYGIEYMQGNTGSVYGFNGVPTPMNINSPDATFAPSDSPTQLPYAFNSSVVTFVMTTGGAYFDATPISIERSSHVQVVKEANMYSKTIDFDDMRRVVKTVSKKN